MLLFSRQFLTTWVCILFICFLLTVWLKLARIQLISTPHIPQLDPVPYFEDSISSERPSLKTESYYKSYLDHEESVRKQFSKKLESFHKNSLSPWINPWNIYFWDAFIPTLTCPHFLERIGAPAGGGKWVCGFEVFENSGIASLAGSPCVLFSFGVGPDSSFEAEFLTRTSCSVYMFDHTSGAPAQGPGSRLPPGMEGRWTYERMGIGNHSSSTIRTLGETMKKYGVGWIDFLKVDIEWNEFTTFDQIMKEFEILPFGHLNLEIHLQNTGEF